MRQIGLFAGIGGFELAARWMSWETIAWCENNPFCQQVLKYHFPKAKEHGDIKATDFSIYRGRCDILTGGFPCQPYSQAGKRLGTEDDRHLWPEMRRAIREIQPRWVVGENVRGLTNWNGGMVFNQVQADLEAEGYEVLPFLLPACAVNAPHRRDRIWFVAYANGRRFARKEHGEAQTKWHTEDGKNRNSSNTYFSSTEHEVQTGWHLLTGKNEPNVTNTPQSNKQRNWLCQECKGLPIGRRSKRKDEFDFFPTQSPVCSGDDGLSSRLAGITFSKHRNESIKVYGNAIVPQVAYHIFKAIEQYEINHPLPERERT